MIKSTNQRRLAAAFLVTAAVLSGCSDGGNGGTAAPTQSPAATNTAGPTSTQAPPTATQAAQPSPTQAAQPTATQAGQPTPTSAPATATASPTATSTTVAQAPPTPAQGGNGRIVFAAANEQFTTDLFVINADGTGRTNITNTGSDSETQPSWSHDGSKILYRLNDNTIAVIGADGSGQHPVITTTGPLYYPAWSADDSKIVFVADEDIATQHDNTIAIVNSDGSNLTTIVSEKGDYLSPSFNPEGTKVAFGSTMGTGIELVIVNADGSDLHQITDDGSVHDGPEWSPTGTDIAYGSFDLETFQGGVYLIHPDGTGAHLLYQTTGASNVAWNRNGSKLAYDGIGIVNADGTNGLLVPNTSDGFDPDLD